MIPTNNWGDSLEIYDTDVMKAFSPDSHKTIRRFSHQGITWRSVEMVYEAFGIDALTPMAYSQSASIALYELWSKDKSIDRDIAGAWAISLGGVIYYFTKETNERMAVELKPLLTDFIPYRAARLVSHFKNAQGKQQWSDFLTVIKHDIDPELLSRVG